MFVLIQGHAPVLPEVGSMTTLFPGMSFPSFSAASTMALAIRSLTEPPAEVYSTFATKVNCQICHKRLAAAGRGAGWVHCQVRTQVAFEAVQFGDLIETDKRGVPHSFEGVV